MFGWFHDFADPEIAGIEAVPGPLPGCATTEPRASSLGHTTNRPSPSLSSHARSVRPVPGPSLGQVPTFVGMIPGSDSPPLCESRVSVPDAR